jgi:hypothetical protein
VEFEVLDGNLHCLNALSAAKLAKNNKHENIGKKTVLLLQFAIKLISDFLQTNQN